MSVEVAQCFFQIFHIILYSETDSERQRALQELDEQLSKAPVAVFSLFLLIIQSPEKPIKQYAILAIQKIIASFLPVSSVDQINEMKNLFIQILTNEDDPLIRKNICEAISSFISYSPNVWPDIANFSNQLLSNDNMRSTGLYLWQLTCEMINEQMLNEIAPFLINAARESMVSEDANVRIAGIQLLNALLWLKYDYSHLIDFIVPSFS